MRQTNIFSRYATIAAFSFFMLLLGACAGEFSFPSSSQPQIAAQPEPAPPAPAPSSASAAPVKVALLLPLSGKNAALGQSMLNAAQMALFDVGGESFELLPRDTKGTAQGAGEAATSAVNEGARLILGPIFAEEVRAVKPAAQSAGIGVIAFSTKWDLADQNTFVMGFMPFDQIDRIASFAASRNITRVGLIAPRTEYGRAVVPAWQSAASRKGIQTPQAITVEPESQDSFDALRNLAGMQAGQIDAIFMPLGGRAAIAASGALSSGGAPPSSVRRLGPGLFDDDALAGDPGMDGAWFAAPSPRLRKPFERRFMETYGYMPPRLSTLSYDATALAVALSRNGNGFSRQSIANPAGFAGLDGIFRFRDNGLAERGLAVLEFRNGQIEILEDAPAAFGHAPQP